MGKKKDKYWYKDYRENAETRKVLFDKLLCHIEQGYSIDCFPWLSLHSIEKALLEFPNEFDQQELEISIRKAQTGWENIGRQQAEGKCIGNSRSWFYNMCHRYGWSDKVKIDADIKGSVNVQVVNYANLDKLKD